MMIYNKAAEEKKWKNWKSNEEKQLRDLGVPETTILELHHFDWELFKAERRFKQRQFTNFKFIDQYASKDMKLPINSIDDLLNQLDNQNLYELMKKVNHQTMEIIYLMICGFTVKEIALKLNLNEDTIRYRIRSVRKKLKKFE